jgi:hypothetical protein
MITISGITLSGFQCTWSSLLIGVSASFSTFDFGSSFERHFEQMMALESAPSSLGSEHLGQQHWKCQPSF